MEVMAGPGAAGERPSGTCSVRLHGRGGQGVVTAAELLSVAAFLDGRHAQAVPSFGSERMGAPVVSYCRISDAPIRTHEPVLEPDALIVQDATLLHQVDLFAGLRRGGLVLVNSGRSPEQLGIEEVREQTGDALITVPATEIAVRRVGRPVPNAVLLGAFAALSQQWVSIASVLAAIRQRFEGQLQTGNVAAAEEAYALVGAMLGEQVGAPAD